MPWPTSPVHSPDAIDAPAEESVAVSPVVTMVFLHPERKVSTPLGEQAPTVSTPASVSAANAERPNRWNLLFRMCAFIWRLR